MFVRFSNQLLFPNSKYEESARLKKKIGCNDEVIGEANAYFPGLERSFIFLGDIKDKKTLNKVYQSEWYQQKI